MGLGVEVQRRRRAGQIDDADIGDRQIVHDVGGALDRNAVEAGLDEQGEIGGEVAVVALKRGADIVGQQQVAILDVGELPLELGLLRPDPEQHERHHGRQYQDAHQQQPQRRTSVPERLGRVRVRFRRPCVALRHQDLARMPPIPAVSVSVFVCSGKG